MTKYWITFRLHYDTVAGRTYEQRYTALTTAIDQLASSKWEEPTSFYIIESQHDIDVCAQHLKAAISIAADLVLIRELDAKDARVSGTVHDLNLYVRMPYLKYV